MDKFEEMLKEWNNGILKGAQSRLANEMNLSHAAIVRWKKGIQFPSEENIKKMSKIFKKTEDKIERAFSFIKEKNMPTTKIAVGLKVGYTPMLGDAFADRFKCIIYEQEPELFLPIVKEGDRDFALRILGDCMVDPSNPKDSIYEGDYVIIRPKAEIKEGDIVLARRGEDCTIKRFYSKENTIYLVPDNPKYKKISGNINDIEIMGKIIHIHRAPKRKKRPDFLQ
jgi:SOS-response transcriptional repressor LexA